MTQHQRATSPNEDVPINEEENQPFITNFESQSFEKAGAEPVNIAELLSLDKDQDQEDFTQALSAQEDLPFKTDFHPLAGRDNSFEDDAEEEMIKIVNPNKHVQNDQDGGRKRKLRHVSKIESFKRGKDAFKNCCKDLFNTKQSQTEVSMESLNAHQSFS